MLSYNDLYELLRKEKYSETLQNLPKSFPDKLAAYLDDKRVESSKEDGLVLGEVGKVKKQLENSIAIFKELMLRRKKKILNLVFVATETGIMKKDYENMLGFESEVFDKLVKGFEDGDKELSKILNGKREDKGEKKNRMIMFSQEVEQFVDMSGNTLGPYTVGELVNLSLDVAEVLVSGGKASYVDED